MPLWFVAVPAATSTPASALSTLKATVPSDGTAVLSPISLPQFKIGTLDGLLVVSDDLQKLDGNCEALCVKMAELVRTLSVEQLEEGMKSTGGDKRKDIEVGKLLAIHDKTFEQYVHGFQWNTSLYRSDRPLVDVMSALAKDLIQMDTTLRTRTQAYNQLKASLQAMERKGMGTWAVKSLTEVVRKEHVDALESEYLVTLFVAVPTQLEKQWWATYERITEMVVPRSSRKVAQDSEFILVNVTLFRKVQDEFITKCREERFMVRDFVFEEGKAERDQLELRDTQDAKRQQRAQLIEWTKGSFGEAAQCWVHVKFLRVFIESVLRYGLPPVYVTAVVEPKKGQESKMLKRLGERYSHLGRQFHAVEKKVGEDGGMEAAAVAVMGDEHDYKEYVFFELKWSPDAK